MNPPEPFSSLPGMKYHAGTSGGEWGGPCPACGGRDRFRAWPDHPQAQGRGGRFMCRGCGRVGDGIAFLREFHGLDYRAACARLGVRLESAQGPRLVRADRPSDIWTPAPFVPPLDAWRTAARRFLSGLPLAVEYGRERSLTPKTVATLGLRWNDRDQFFPRSQWGLPEEASSETGRPKRVWAPRGMVIPNLRGGRGVGLKIRRADPGDGAKYVMVSGSAKASFVLPGVSKAMVVVEGELDAALIHQEAGDVVTALALGTARGKPDADAAALLRAASVILTALDFDRAGAEAWPWWRKHFTQAVRWPTPTAKDAGDYHAAGGDVRAWIEAGLPAAPARQAKPKRQAPPYQAEYLARVAREHPNLVCCPRSTPAWSWRDKTACASCGGCGHAA